MLKVTLKEKNGILEIKKYEISFPFSLYGENNDGNTVYWNLHSVKCENLKGSYHLNYCNKIDFSDGKSKTNDNSIITVKDGNVQEDNNAIQYFMFSLQPLFYINEKDVSNSLECAKKKLPRTLLKSELKAKESIHFFMTYDNNKKLFGEELSFYLNLFEK